MALSLTRVCYMDYQINRYGQVKGEGQTLIYIQQFQSTSQASNNPTYIAMFKGASERFGDPAFLDSLVASYQ